MFWSVHLCSTRRLLFLIYIIKSVVSLDQKFFFEQHRHQLLLKCMTFIFYVCSQEIKWANFSNFFLIFFFIIFFPKLTGYILSARAVRIHSFEKLEQNSSVKIRKKRSRICVSASKNALFLLYSDLQQSSPWNRAVWLYTFYRWGNWGRTWGKAETELSCWKLKSRTLSSRTQPPPACRQWHLDIRFGKAFPLCCVRTLLFQC